MLKNNKGFSLIELMVVVAIIAILASFAIPQYQNFQSKARQKEANVLLGGYYMAAVASKSELAGYPGNFVASGFNPAGHLHYRISVVDGATNPLTGPNNDACINTLPGTSCTPMTKNYVEETVGSFLPAAPSACSPSMVDADHFVACASGTIDTSAGVDEWSINEIKTFLNPHSGID